MKFPPSIKSAKGTVVIVGQEKHTARIQWWCWAQNLAVRVRDSKKPKQVSAALPSDTKVIIGMLSGSFGTMLRDAAKSLKVPYVSAGTQRDVIAALRNHGLVEPKKTTIPVLVLADVTPTIFAGWKEWLYDFGIDADLFRLDLGVNTADAIDYKFQLLVMDRMPGRLALQTAPRDIVPVKLTSRDLEEGSFFQPLLKGAKRFEAAFDNEMAKFAVPKPTVTFDDRGRKLIDGKLVCPHDALEGQPCRKCDLARARRLEQERREQATLAETQARLAAAAAAPMVEPTGVNGAEQHASGVLDSLECQHGNPFWAKCEACEAATGKPTSEMRPPVQAVESTSAPITAVDAKDPPPEVGDGHRG